MSISPDSIAPAANNAVLQTAKNSTTFTPAVPVTKLFAWLICGLGALFYCYEYLLRISPSVMAPDLMQAYHIDAAAFGNLAAFYYYAYTPMQLPVGVLMDHYGPRRLLIFACLVCAVGTYMFASHEHGLLLAQIGRFLVGFGSAFAFVGVLKLATLWLPANQFGMIAGLATTLGMVGAMAGDISLASLVKAEGWRATIILSAVAGIVLALIIGLVMPDTAHKINKPQKSTLADFKLLFVGLFKLLGNKYIWLNGFIGCLMYLPLSAFAELWGIPYLEGAFQYTRTEAASLMSVVFLGWAIGGPIAGWISDRIGRRCLPIAVGAVLSTMVIAALIYIPGLSKTTMLGLLFLLGAFASVQVIVFAIAREVSPGNLAATSLAFTNMLVMLGGVFLQPIIGMLLDMHTTGKVEGAVHNYTLLDYQYALLALPVGMLLAALLMFLMKETHGVVQETK